MRRVSALGRNRVTASLAVSILSAFWGLGCCLLLSRRVSLPLGRCRLRSSKNLNLTTKLFGILHLESLLFCLSGRFCCLRGYWQRRCCCTLWTDRAKCLLHWRYLFWRCRKQRQRSVHLWYSWVLDSWTFPVQLCPRVGGGRVLLCSWHFWQGSRCLLFPVCRWRGTDLLGSKLDCMNL